MNEIQFRALVGTMRNAQKNYFKSRKGSEERIIWLQNSKKYEKLVDEELKDQQKLNFE